MPSMYDRETNRSSNLSAKRDMDSNVNAKKKNCFFITIDTKDEGARANVPSSENQLFTVNVEFV